MSRPPLNVAELVVGYICDTRVVYPEAANKKFPLPKPAGPIDNFNTAPDARTNCGNPHWLELRFCVVYEVDLDHTVTTVFLTTHNPSGYKAHHYASLSKTTKYITNQPSCPPRNNTWLRTQLHRFLPLNQGESHGPKLRWTMACSCHELPGNAITKALIEPSPMSSGLA